MRRPSESRAPSRPKPLPAQRKASKPRILKANRIGKTKLRINGDEWSIVVTPDLAARAKSDTNYWKNPKDLLGLTIYADKTILVKGGLSDAQMEQTLFHELIHAVAPSLHELRVASLEVLLWPVLRRFGLRLF